MDTIGAVIIIALVVFLLVNMLAPFMPYMAAGLVLFVIISVFYRRYKTW